jgi:hypothetical protein
MHRRLVRSALLAALCAVVVLTPGAAYASTALPNATVVTTSTAGDYTFSTTSYYWSVVAIATPVNYDLDLWVSNGRLPMDSSTQGTGLTDFIAINSNLRALGAYRAVVGHVSGIGSYSIEQVQGDTVTTLPIPANDGVSGPSDPDLAFAVVRSQDVIGISDVYLNAGDSFWVNTAGTDDGFYFLESNPAVTSTFVRSRAQAATVPGTRTAQGCTLYTANYTGWHGLVAVNPDPPHATDPGSGTAFALHRFDPARQNTCPQRNFPAPTPPGP